MGMNMLLFVILKERRQKWVSGLLKQNWTSSRNYMMVVYKTSPENKEEKQKVLSKHQLGQRMTS